jgi:hypothetical protein
VSLELLELYRLSKQKNNHATAPVNAVGKFKCIVIIFVDISYFIMNIHLDIEYNLF